MGLFNNNEEKLNKLLEELGSLNAKVDLMTNKLDSLSSNKQDHLSYTNPDHLSYTNPDILSSTEVKKEYSNVKNNNYFDKEYTKNAPVKVIKGSDVKIYPTVSSAVRDLKVPYSRVRSHIKTIDGYRVINIKSVNNRSKFEGIPVTTYKSGNVIKEYPSKRAIIEDLHIASNTLDTLLKKNNKGYFINLEDLEKSNNMVNFV